jgi:hypothetical protein
MLCVCVAVTVVCIVAAGCTLITMAGSGVEEVPEALLEVAKGNAHFTNALYKVRGSCLADANFSSLLCLLGTE